MAALLTATGAQAAPITIAEYDYDSNVNPGAGTGVASWAASSTSDASAGIYDWGNGGLSIFDASSVNSHFYSQAISDDNIALMSNGWAATWTVTSDVDIYSYGNDYITNERQQNAAFWLETQEYGRYFLSLRHDVDTGMVSVTDSASTWEIGNFISQQWPDGEEVDMRWMTFSMVYDASTGLTTLSEASAGELGVVTSAAGSQNRVLFGCVGGATRGAASWNSVLVEANEAIPEPSTWAMLVLGSLTLLGARFLRIWSA